MYRRPHCVHSRRRSEPRESSSFACRQPQAGHFTRTSLIGFPPVVNSRSSHSSEVMKENFPSLKRCDDSLRRRKLSPALGAHPNAVADFASLVAAAPWTGNVLRVACFGCHLRERFVFAFGDCHFFASLASWERLFRSRGFAFSSFPQPLMLAATMQPIRLSQ